jgi:hypothetical protein
VFKRFWLDKKLMLFCIDNILNRKSHVGVSITGTCFIQKICAPSSSLLQGKHLPFSPSPLHLNIFCLFVILSLTQLYRYTLEIFRAHIFWMKQVPVIETPTCDFRFKMLSIENNINFLSNQNLLNTSN